MSTLTTSSAITISGLGATSPVSVSGGEVSIAGGAWVTSGSISNGQTITVRRTSSASFSTEVTATVTIGTISDTWNVTTRAADLVPAAFNFTTINSAEAYTVYTSNTVTVTGLEPNYAGVIVSVINGTVDAGTSSLSGTYAASKSVTTSGSGTLVVSTRGTSSGYNSDVTIKAVIGGVEGWFTINTRAADTTPNSYSFVSQSNANTNTAITSGTITIGGLEPGIYVGVSCSNATASAGTTTISGSYSSSFNVLTSPSGSIVIAARVTSSSSFSTSVVGTINVGSGSGTFTVTTRAADTTPNSFSFTSQTGANLNTLTTSSLITVTGLEPNHPIAVTCTGGSIDAGTSSAPGFWTTAKSVTTSGSGTLVVRARLTSSNSFSTTTSCTIGIGGSSSANFSVTTRAADTTPNAFSFTDVTNSPPNITVYSNTITIGGLEPNYTTTVYAAGDSGYGISFGTSSISGSYSAGGNVTTSSSGTFVLRARVNAAGSELTTRSCTVALGGVSDVFSVTTGTFGGGA